MVEVRNTSRIHFAAEGSISPSGVRPTKLRSEPRAEPRATLTVRLREGLWLAALPTRFWISRTAPDTTQAISAPAIASLLEGAVAAASLLCAPRQPLTPAQWIWRLVGEFQVTHSSPALLEFAAGRFAADQQLELADWARARARAQAEQHRLVVRDLQAMDVDLARALAAMRPHPAERLVGWLRASVLADPIACVGFAHAVESLALQLGEAKREALDAMLPADARPTRCARVRDDHREQTLALLSRLSATRCEAIARAAFEVACLWLTPPPDCDLDDASIAHQAASQM